MLNPCISTEYQLMNRASVRRRVTLSSIMSEFIPPGYRARADKKVRCSCRVSHLSDPVF
jgi:hypothetical protein